MADQVPAKIAKYDIVKLLGRGAMGVVYQGYDSQIERKVAIKVLDSSKSAQNKSLLEARFLQEAKSAARCQHPKIVTVYDFGYDQVPYIAMEYVEGIELRAFLNNNTSFSLNTATNICTQILSALSHAHSQQVIHRDIKPANIIILENGDIKVSDFGVAHLGTNDAVNQGFVVGTPGYMSPEGLQGQTVDHRSDLYSLGVLFFELLTQCRPCREKSLEQNLIQLDSVEHIPEDSIAPLKKLFRKALHPNLNKRYQSADEFILGLQAIGVMDAAETQTRFTIPEDYQPPTHSTSRSGSQWTDEILHNLETSLAHHVGPIAKHLVRRNSASVDSLQELLDNLSQHIPNPKERTQFRSHLESSGIRPALATQQQHTTVRLDTEVVATCKRLNPSVQKQLEPLLAYYLGPMAGRVINQQAKLSLSLPELVSALASQIPNLGERNQFLSRASRL